MKTSVAAAVAACLAASVAAFPRELLNDPAAANALADASLLRSRAASPPQGKGAMPLIPPPFDKASQYVSTTGQYAFKAPKAGDARGECPGLNAMANHGYLPHNGVATITQFASACQKVFGMGPDLALFLATFGAVVDGDLTSWSIDGKPHTGIGGSHGNYETDSSPLKADLYQYGDLDKLVLSQYKDLFKLQPDASTANYNLEVLRDFRKTRFEQSIQMNPDFYYGAFSGMAVSQAAFTFIYRFMANKSAEYPEGILNQDVLKSFMSITGTDDNPVWTKGHERIPDNWYTRNSEDLYTIAYFETDILYIAETVPEINLVGCNLGKVNTFDSISVSTLSGGAYTAAQVAKHPLCFATEYALAELPGLTGLSTAALAPLTTILGKATSALNCSPITNLNSSALSICPGLSLYGGPKAKVAKGAIQK